MYFLSHERVISWGNNLIFETSFPFILFLLLSLIIFIFSQNYLVQFTHPCYDYSKNCEGDIYMAAKNHFFPSNDKAQVYEQQEQQQEFENALQYTGRIYESGRDMRDQYCRGDYNDACTSAEQLTENSLNAVAELNGGLTDEFQNHITLVKRKKKYCPELPVSNNSLRRMEKAYKNRYPDPTTKKIQHQYTQEEAKKMIIDACKVGDYALNILDISIYERFKQFGEPSDKKDIDSLKLQNLLFNGSTNEYNYTL